MYAFAFGPWVEGIDWYERIARLRALRALANVLAHNQGEFRAALALASGWGLIQHARWGRIFAIFVAIVSLFRFPLGTALGIWTLVVLLGARNAVLYEQL